MFFEKSWSEVTDSDIDELATQLAERMGGWVFHSRVDFSKPTPWLELEGDQPEIMIRESNN